MFSCKETTFQWLGCCNPPGFLPANLLFNSFYVKFNIHFRTSYNENFIVKMLLCIGPEGTGKTLLLRRIVSQGDKNFVLKTIPTVGVDIQTYKQGDELPAIHIRELGKNNLL